ncbi:MAG TPA: oligosaccharide flippase family protein [Candidatus Dormibacteraeota bacterium]|nr:oligosaccharide flippase family protein [Candidatus Dormibacteraeota bacterium]
MTAPQAGTPAADAGGPIRFDLRAFTRSAGLLSLGPLANLVRAIVTAKLFAITLGPSTVGILVQLLNFSALISSFVQFGLTTGVVKLVAEARNDQGAISRVAGTAAALSLATALAATAALLPFAGHLSALLTGSDRYGPLVALLALSFPLYNLAGAVGYVLQGLSAVRRLTRASVANAAAAAAVLVPATIAFGLAGAIASVLIGSLVQSALYAGELWLAYRERGWRLTALRAARREARLLLGFGTVLLAGGIANWGALLVVRTILVRTLGQHDNGLYQAVYGFSSQYITVFMTWMAAYVFPRIAARGAGGLDDLLNSGLRANLFLMAPVLSGVVALRDPLIQVFYAPAFLPAASLVLVQVLGDYARVVGWSMGVALFALGRLRAHLLLIAGQDVLWVLLAAVLIPRIGLPAVSVAYALSYLSWPLVTYPMLRAWFGFRLTATSLWLVAAGLVAVLAAGLLPQPAGVVAIPVVPLLLLLERRAGAARA